MKLTLLRLALAVGLMAAAGTHAAISVSPAGYTNDFASLAAVTNAPPTGWWTKSVLGGDNLTLSNAVQLDASVLTNDAASINTGLGASGTVPPTANAVARWNGTLQNLQTRPTGNMYTLLLAELQNNTGTNCNTLVVGYDLNLSDPGGVVEELPGHRLYYSLSGAAGSWQPIGNESGVGRVSLSVPLAGAWLQGASLYLLWADDNGSGADYAYQIDNLHLAAFASPNGLSMVTWDVDPTNSFVRLTIPDQTINVPDVGNVTVRLRDAGNSSSWTDAGGRRAALDGTILTEYVDGSSIRFLGGAHDLIAVEATNLRPNPADWNAATTNYINTTTAPAALGARVRATISFLTVDAAFIAFRQVRLDIAQTESGALSLTNGAFAANATRAGIALASLDVDGLEIIGLGQPIPDLRDTPLSSLVETNASGGSITNLGGLKRRLTYTINIPRIELDLSGTIVTGSVAGLVVASADLPEPLVPVSLSARKQGANIVLAWPTNAPGYSLYYATNVPSTNWLPAAPPPVIANGQYVVTNATPGHAVFYRLQKP